MGVDGLASLAKICLFFFLLLIYQYMMNMSDMLCHIMTSKVIWNPLHTAQWSWHPWPASQAPNAGWPSLRCTARRGAPWYIELNWELPCPQTKNTVQPAKTAHGPNPRQYQYLTKRVRCALHTGEKAAAGPVFGVGRSSNYRWPIMD